MKKSALCICENKGAVQLCLLSNRAANQHFCFHYIERIIPLLSRGLENLMGCMVPPLIAVD